MCSTGSEEVVAVEVEHQDHSEGWLPGQAHAGHNVNNTVAEPGDEAKLRGGGERERYRGSRSDQGRGCLNKSELANIAGCRKMCDWEDRRRKMHGLKEQH